MHVQLAEYDVVFEKWRDAALKWQHCIDRVAEVSGVAELVAGRERGRICRGERREERVAVDKIDSFSPQSRHRRGGRRIDDRSAQPIAHKEDKIVRTIGERSHSHEYTENRRSPKPIPR